MPSMMHASIFKETSPEKQSHFVMSSNVIFALVLLGELWTATSWDWSYDYRSSNGPKDWVKNYPDCGGERQSPIDLKDFSSENGARFTWSDDYNEAPEKMAIKNTGRTMVLTGEGNKPRMTLDDGKVFELFHVHFHWGSSERYGSDHYLMGKEFALEMQALHNRVNHDGSVASPSEMLTISELFKETETSEDSGLDHLLDEAEGVIENGQEVEIEPFVWFDLIYPHKSFYRYEGSLTTPPCSEVVTYFIAKHTRSVSSRQMAIFRNLLNEDQEPISGNFRPLQERGDRKVYQFIQK